MVEVVIPAQPGFSVLLDFEKLRRWVASGDSRDELIQDTVRPGAHWSPVIGWRVKQGDNAFALPILPCENEGIDWDEAVLMAPDGTCRFVLDGIWWASWVEMVDDYIKFGDAAPKPEVAQPQ